jgi:NTP pyrophosphatase (non-canonical NTP hydrolase)
MKFDDYQKQAITTDIYGGRGDILSIAFLNKILGLAGETGEIAEKVKKLQRNKAGKMNAKDRQELLKELGDVIWYLSAIAYYLDEPLSDVAKSNIDKLFDRKARGVIKSKGDNR